MENKGGKEPGLVDTQQQVDPGQVGGGEIGRDFGYIEGNDVLDLPGASLQQDPVGEGVPLLGLLPSNLQVLSDRCAW